MIDTCCSQPKLFIQGQTLISEEGTTQGDLLAMALYALAIAPLMMKCANNSTQVWYADDASAGGTVRGIFSWKSCEYTPRFGYFPKASKSSAIIKPDFKAKALEKFDDTDLVVKMREESIWEFLWVLQITASNASVLRSKNGAGKWKTW